MASFDIYPEVKALLKPEIDTLPLPPQPNASNVSNAYNALTLLPLAIYPSKEALFEAIQRWAKDRGYVYITGKSKRQSRRQKVYYICDRRLLTPLQAIRIQATQSRGTRCLFSILAIKLSNSLGWEIRYRPETKYNTHNHPPSQSLAVHSSHRHLSVQALATSINLFLVG
jgi:hypothetical protein